MARRGGGGAGQVGGAGGPIKRAAWLFVAACIAVAVWNGLSGGEGTLYDRLAVKSSHLSSKVHGWVARAGLPEDGKAPDVKVPVVIKTAKAPSPTKK